MSKPSCIARFPSIGTSATPSADQPAFKPNAGWLKPAAEMETIGAHGDVAVSSAGEVYVSVIGGPRGVETKGRKLGILTAPHGIEINSRGNIFVSEFNKFGRVLRYDPAD